MLAFVFEDGEVLSQARYVFKQHGGTLSLALMDPFGCGECALVLDALLGDGPFFKQPLLGCFTLVDEASFCFITRHGEALICRLLVGLA